MDDYHIWICLCTLVSSCKNIFISIVLRTCGLETFVLCATECIHHVFKCIRNVYDSVKFLCDVMLLFQPSAVLAVSDRSDRSEGSV